MIVTDEETQRFDGQAIGLAHHALGDAFYRQVGGVDWQTTVLPLMKHTYRFSIDFLLKK